MAHRNVPARRRRGLTIIELMVTIAIVAVTLGLIIPALQGTRCGTSYRTSCMNNTRQLGLAFQIYLNRAGRFPNATTWGEHPSALASKDASQSILQDINAQGPGRFAPAGTDGSPTDVGPLHSWVVELLPDLDVQTLYNDFNFDRVSYDDPASGIARADGWDTTRASNLTIGSTGLSMLQCPSDGTCFDGSGNLSYVVNMGWTLWHADGVNGLSACESAKSWTPTTITWGPPERGGGIDAFRKTGLMFQGTAGGDAPWDVHHTPASVTDGLGTTILLAENNFAGASPGRFEGGRHVVTNWASADPRAVGFTADPTMCPQVGPGCGPFRCDLAALAPSARGDDGRGWGLANRKGRLGAIDGGYEVGAEEGMAPHPNDNHPGGFVVGMADGSAHFVSDRIDGSIYAKLMTPAGESLARRFRQLPLAPDSIPYQPW